MFASAVVNLRKKWYTGAELINTSKKRSSVQHEVTDELYCFGFGVESA